MNQNAFCKNRRFFCLASSSKIIRIMKLSGIFLLAACLQVSASAYSQRVTLTQHNIPIEKVFRQIKKQTGYMFLYNNEMLQHVNFVSIDAKNAPLETVLEQCFKNQPITYEIVDKTIIVKPRPLVTASTAVAPPVVVSGTVTDENGQAMPGVGIALKGTRTATVSNERGEYTISIPEE